MNKYNLTFYFFVFLLFVFSCFSFLEFYFGNKLTEINCDSNVILINKEIDLYVNVQYTFSLNEIYGWLKVKGEINQGNDIYSINRKLYFKYHRNENVFLLKINEITTGIDDNSPSSLLSTFLPSAYTQEGLKMDLFIYPQTNKGYIITSSDHYGIYCSN